MLNTTEQGGRDVCPKREDLYAAVMTGVTLASFEITGLDFTQKRVLYPTKNPLHLFSVGDTSSQHLLSSIILHALIMFFISCLIALFLLFRYQESVNSSLGQTSDARSYTKIRSLLEPVILAVL